jgi:hypothetical protein
MLKSIFRILGRITIILLAAAVVIGLAFGASKLIPAGTSRFRPDDGQRFTAPAGTAGTANSAGQPNQPPRGRGGDDEGFQDNGSLARGLFQVFTNTLLIGVFTWVGVLLLRYMKRRTSTGLPDQVDP